MFNIILTAVLIIGAAVGLGFKVVQVDSTDQYGRGTRNYERGRII